MRKNPNIYIESFKEIKILDPKRKMFTKFLFEKLVKKLMEIK